MVQLIDIAKLPKNRSAVSELVYIALNAGLAIGLLIVVLAVKSPLPALALVLLSKWRVLAVRPRFWLKNIRANLVDTIVGLSVVVLLYAASGALVVQILMTALFIAWLLIIKPRSKRQFVVIQSGVASFLGTTALFMSSFDWPAAVVVLGMYVIGYGTSRHVLRHYHDKNRNLLAMIWGVIIAEIGWLGYHWSFAYDLPGLDGFSLSQVALIVLALSFLAERAYDSYHHNEGVIQSSDIMMPLVFSVSIILIVLLFFNTLGIGLI